MSGMCEYCEGGEPLLLDITGDQVFKMSVKEGELVLDVRLKYTLDSDWWRLPQHYVGISFCPKCGRKL